MNLHYNSVVSNITKMARKIESQRRVAQSMNQNEYEQALVKVKEKIRLTEGTDMQERMEEQIRQWFLECRYSSSSYETRIANKQYCRCRNISAMEFPILSRLSSFQSGWKRIERRNIKEDKRKTLVKSQCLIGFYKIRNAI